MKKQESSHFQPKRIPQDGEAIISSKWQQHSYDQFKDWEGESNLQPCDNQQ